MQPRQWDLAIFGMFAMLLCSATQAHEPGCEHLVNEMDQKLLQMVSKVLTS